MRSQELISTAQALNVSAAQQVLYHRARCNSAARLGKYNAALETDIKRRIT